VPERTRRINFPTNRARTLCESTGEHAPAPAQISAARLSRRASPLSFLHMRAEVHASWSLDRGRPIVLIAMSFPRCDTKSCVAHPLLD
jgi:hypothetical protein